MVKRREFPIYIVAVIVYIVTAINSNGYYHPDEHYQIIEFAGIKSGWNIGNDLTWEYNAQIRPALQPSMALCLFKFFSLFGITNPFLLAMGLRLITAGFSFVCIFLFIRSFKNTLKPEFRILFLLVSFFIWFIPAINVRFSSETWAGSVLLLSIALINRVESKNAISFFIIGLLWGLCFEFRFQMGVILFSVFLWLIFIRKETLRNLLLLCLGGSVIIASALILDSWFYGNWVFVPWNYFHINLIQDVASQFGTSPWYFYIVQLFVSPTPIIGCLIVLALLFLMFYDYKHIVVWCVIPIFVVHTLIPHKELRFLFPIVNFIPLIMVLFLQKIYILFKKRKIFRISEYLVGILVLINLGGLFMMSFKPCFDGNVNIMQYLYKRQGRINLYVVEWSNPYILGANVKGLTPRFYANNRVSVKELSDTSILKWLGDNDLVIMRKTYQEQFYMEREGFTIEKKSVPDWITTLDRFYKVRPNYDYVFILYSKQEAKNALTFINP